MQIGNVHTVSTDIWVCFHLVQLLLDNFFSKSWKVQSKKVGGLHYCPFDVSEEINSLLSHTSEAIVSATLLRFCPRGSINYLAHELKVNTVYDDIIGHELYGALAKVELYRIL